MNMNHMDYLEQVARKDLEHLRTKEQGYRGSWKQRGGVGAFMMLARKWDRLRNALEPDNETDLLAPLSKVAGCDIPAYNLFIAWQYDPRKPENLAQDIGDLRRYLMLVEAEMLARANAPTQEDFGPRLATALESIKLCDRCGELMSGLMIMEQLANGQILYRHERCVRPSCPCSRLRAPGALPNWLTCPAGEIEGRILRGGRALGVIAPSPV